MALIPLKDLVIDIKKHTQEIILGPQGELFEALNSFNQNFNLKLKFKNDFTWNRGTYKAITEKAQQIFINQDRKIRYLMGIFNYTGGVEYRMRNFKDRLRTMNDDMRKLRWKNFKVMDNNVDAEALWTQFLEYIDVKIALAHKLFPSIKISIAVEERNDQYSMDDLIRNYLVIKVMFTENTIIKCYDENGKEVLDEVELYPFTLMYGNDLFQTFNGWSTHYEKTDEEKYKLISAVRRRVSRYHQQSRGWKAEYHPNNKALRHPYIGSPSSRSDNQWTNVCFGDFVSDIGITTDMLDFPSLLHTLEEWTSMYHVGRTNPLQNMQYWRLGVPMNLTIEQANFSGMDPRWCYNSQAMEAKDIDFLTTCHNCQLNPINMPNNDDDRDECEYYSRHQQITNKELMNEESMDILAERLIQWTKDVILKDRIINNLDHEEKHMSEIYDKLDTLKPEYLYLLLNRVQTHFRDLLTNNISYSRFSNLSRNYMINESVLRQVRAMEDTISACKSEWFQRHHNGYDRLVNEIELWDKSFSKMREDRPEVDPSEGDKEKEAWLAMLKRTEQEVNTPIGR